ncbi:MAG TPA: YIP1 family protein [Gemmatimonadales bacterium]|nr:YIP1 family protein [Gemmatimonadales bacterium]
MRAVLDLVNVLFEPAAVFGRVGEKPRFLAPFLALAAVQVVVAILMLPYTRPVMEAAMAQAMKAQGASGAPPNAAAFAYVGVIAQPIILIVLLLLGTAVVWVMTSLLGGEGKFTVLLSVLTYSAVAFIIQLVVTLLVLVLRGAQNIQSPADLQPALGLDLLAPDAKGFVGGLLKGVNPFSIAGYWLTGIGVSVTHRLPRSTGYAIAAASFVVMLVVSAALAMLGPGGGGR